MAEMKFFCVKCRQWSPEPVTDPQGPTMYVICPKCGHRMSDEDHSHEVFKAGIRTPPTDS